MDKFLSFVPPSPSFVPTKRHKSSSSLSQTPTSRRQRSSTHSLIQPSPSIASTPSSFSSYPSSSSSSSSRISRSSHASPSQPLTLPTSLSSSSLLSFARPYSIVRVTMKNFMCYTSHTVYLGPHLNLVVGPNGAGKSTLVCAICLGLGGVIGSLGRMDELSGHIKKGEEEGSVEIELFASMTGREEDGNRCIRRVMRSDNKSTFYSLTPHSHSKTGWREEEVSMKWVKDLMKTYDVHVDNLCVLLAQDRVSRFAELKPTELLMETEKAANEEYHLQHKRLIEMRKEEKEYEKTVGGLQRSLDQKKGELQELEPEMKRREERKEEEERMVVMKRRRPWTEYRQEENKGEVLKEKRAVAIRAVEEEKGRQKPIKAVLQRATKEWEEAEEKKRLVKKAADKLAQDRREALDKVKALGANVEKKQEELLALEDDEERHVEEVQRRTQRVREQEEVVLNLPDLTEVQERLRQAREESKALMKENAIVKSEMGEIGRDIAGLQMEVRDIDTRRSQRSRRAEGRADALFNKARQPKYRTQYELVQEAKKRQRLHRAKLDHDPSYIHDAGERKRMNDPKEDKYVLKGQVYGPLALELEYKDEQVGDILETLIDFNRKFIYITDHQDDAVWLGWQANGSMMVALRSGEEARALHPSALRSRVDLAQFEHLGVVSYLNEAVSAPPLVMSWLADTSSITTIPYGRRELKANELEELFPARLPGGGQSWVRVLYTPSHEHSIRFSKYGSRDRSMTDRQVQKAHLFSRQVEEEGGGEDERLTELKHAIERRQAEMNEVKKKEEAIARQHAINGEQRGQCEAALRKDKSERDRLVQYKRELDGVRREANVEARKERLRREIETCQKRQVETVKELVRVETEWVDAMMHVDVWSIQAQHKQSEKEFIENKAAAHGTTLIRLNTERKKAEDDYTKHQQRITALRHTAERECDEADVMGLDWLPDSLTLDELDDRIDIAQQTLDSFHAGDDVALVQKYEQCKKDVDTLTHQLQDKLDLHSTHAEQIAQLRAEWLTSIRELISHVNTAFSHYMRTMGNAGEVTLVEHSDFDQYAIVIRVAFNPPKGETPHLNPLSQYFQSGGEKSVTTMIYLICLQGVTNAPFRIVDEINQGMDHKNEEKIFNLIVHASSTFTDRTKAIRGVGMRAGRGEEKGREEEEDEGVVKGKGLTPQYILVSPKLLPGLNMPEEVGMRVIVMMGGAMGKEAADRKRKTGGTGSAWEKPMKVVQCADQWTQNKKERRKGKEEEGVRWLDGMDSDSSLDSDSEVEEEADGGEVEEKSRGTGRGGKGRAKDGRSAAADVDEFEDELDVDVMVELSREWEEEFLD